MNSSRKLGWFLALALAPIFPASALTVNDGSTTNNLAQIFNSSTNSQGDAVVSLQLGDCSTNCALTALQTGESGFALRSAWYATDVAPTGGVYTVSAGFEPANVANQNRGGVMGWLSLSASNGIILQVVPEDNPFIGDPKSDPKSFRVAWVDFSADTGNENESLAHLFNTNGTPATNDFNSAWSELGTNYSATNFATFQLAFSAPTAPDLAALTNATAHVTARVFQGTETNGTPIQVSRSIELLTDLPLPSPGNHRIGYYAVWALVIQQGDIGYLDNLTAEGGVSTTTIAPPMLTIVLAANTLEISWPAAGYQLQMKTNLSSPTWIDVPNSLITNRVTLTISGGIAFFRLFQQNAPTGPRLTMLLSGNTVVVSWPQVTGYRLQAKADLNAATWTDVATVTNQVTETITGTSRFYRLSP